jgi:hypothetical protein
MRLLPATTLESISLQSLNQVARNWHRRILNSLAREEEEFLNRHNGLRVDSMGQVLHPAFWRVKPVPWFCYGASSFPR